ncbi:MAG: PEP-utilizing enzyme [Leucothrix sp.]
MTDLAKPIPEKYAKLKQAASAGLPIPKSLLLNFDEGFEVTKRAIDDFATQSGSLYFIIRSAHLDEDGSDLSLAGHFWSSGAVIADEIDATIKKALKKNAVILESLNKTKFSTAHTITSFPSLILQAYIEHNIGGVLFYPWGFYSDYAYVEYSDAGVKQVVDGQDSHSAVLCLDEQYADPLPLTQVPIDLQKQLIDLCHELRGVYDFPLDCEWALDQEKQQITVLQVRPQTHSIGPVLPYSALASADAKVLSGQQITSNPSNFQFTALSESLGRLSPLSFSLLEQLYRDSRLTLQKLGCKAAQVDFMMLAPDGTVLVDPELEKRFYAMTLFGGFKRGTQQAIFANEAGTLLNHYDVSRVFAAQTLQQLFAYWVGVNVLSAGAGRGSGVIEFIEPPHAYELSWLTPPDRLVVSLNQLSCLGHKNDSTPKNLEVLNAELRALFLFELNKLKWQLKRQNQHKTACYFCDWSTLQMNGLTPALEQAAMLKQHTQAPWALYDFALIGSGAGEVQSLSSSKPVAGRLLMMTHSASAKSSFTGRILVATSFDNHWVSQIQHLKGIVVRQGSRLSHSAIVAREYNVPYYVVPELDMGHLSQEQLIALDPSTLIDLFTSR